MDRVDHSTPPATTPQLQLMLFVNRRAKADRQVQAIRQAIEELGKEGCFELKVAEVSARPSLVEHFKLVAVPALVKTHPLPEQVFAGSDLISQLRYWWPRWQLAMQDSSGRSPTEAALMESDVVMAPEEVSEQMLQLSDEIFKLKQENTTLHEQLKFRDRVMAILAHDLRSPLTTASLALETLEIGLKQHWSSFLEPQAAAANPRSGSPVQSSRSSVSRRSSSSSSAASSGASSATVSPEPPSRLSPQMMRRLAQQTRSQLRQLDEMMDDILQASQGETDELRIRPEALDLQRLCREVIEQLSDRRTAKSQLIKVDIPSDLPPVCADSERIRQVLINLLDNAIKYTPEEGELTFSCLHRTSQTVQVSLSDNGPGIPQGLERTIFNDSFRLPRDRELSGYGIGLSVCRQVILAHYGRIWVSPHLPRGSSFHFTLPVYT